MSYESTLQCNNMNIILTLQRSREQLAKLRSKSEAAQKRQSAIEASEITRLDPNDTASCLDTTLPDSGAATPQRHQAMSRGDDYSGEHAVPRPRQKGRQAERQQMAPEPHSPRGVPNKGSLRLRLVSP